MPNPNDQPSCFISDDTKWPFRHVSLFCDRRCGVETGADIRADTLAEAFAGLRELAAVRGWTITDTEDVCPNCSAEGSL